MTRERNSNRRSGGRAAFERTRQAKGRAKAKERARGRDRESDESVGLLRRAPGRGAQVTLFHDDRHRRFDIPRGAARDARDGDWVQIAPMRSRSALREARVVAVLGAAGSPDADFQVVVARHRLRVEFLVDALTEVETIARRPAPATHREDLRGLAFVTIDPTNARDHDDAVYVEDRPRGGARLWVAIADVSALVPEGSALDREALRRGNSVYFPDRAIPMLPPTLSGDLCSLRPGVDRGVVTVVLEIARDGSVRACRFARAVIQSRAKLSYDAAACVMDPAAERPAGAVPPADPVVVDQLLRLARVARALQANRFATGSIDFDLPTAEILLGDGGHPVDVIRAPRTLAHRAIEEAMLAANRAVAEALLAAGVPLLHRIHEAPAPEDLAALADLLASFGLLERGEGGALDARTIARAVSRAAGRPEERLVNLVTLRAMQQARYCEAGRGHFALAFAHYTHFTSPIRRYADLVVHRALLDHLDAGAEARARAAARGKGLARIAARVSARERIAVEAERDMLAIKKCVFIAKHVGTEFDGTIESVAPHGLYVTLAPFFVEGLVPARRLPYGAAFDARGHAFTMRRGSARWRLGDRVRVRIERVDVARGWISLALVSHAAAAPARRPRRAGYDGA